MLSSNIPESDLHILELQCFNIEANGGDGGDELILFEFEEYCCLASTIQTQCDHSHLYLGTNVNSVVLGEGDGDSGVKCRSKLVTDPSKLLLLLVKSVD